MPSYANLSRANQSLPTISVDRDAVTVVTATSLAATSAYLYAGTRGLDSNPVQVDLTPQGAVTALARRLVALPLAADPNNPDQADYQKQGTIYVKPSAVYGLVAREAAASEIYVEGAGMFYVAKPAADLRSILA